MGIRGIIPVVVGIIFVMILSSGCINTNSVNQQNVAPTPDVSAAGLLRSGFTAFTEGKYDTALDYYNRSIAADPTYAPAWTEKGNVLIRLNRTEEAISAYDSALALESGLPRVWNSRGEALMTLGRYTEARDSFDKALQVAPEYAKAIENRELALTKLQ